MGNGRRKTEELYISYEVREPNSTDIEFSSLRTCTTISNLNSAHYWSQVDPRPNSSLVTLFMVTLTTKKFHIRFSLIRRDNYIIYLNVYERAVLFDIVQAANALRKRFKKTVTTFPGY